MESDGTRGLEAAPPGPDRATGGPGGGTLEALSLAFPYPAFAHHRSAGVAWTSAEWAARLGVLRSQARGAGDLELPGLGEALAGDGPAAEAHVAGALRAAGLLHNRERVLLRRLEEDGGALTLVMLVPARPGQAAGGALLEGAADRAGAAAGPEDRRGR